MGDFFPKKSSKTYQCQFCEENIDRNYKEDHYSTCTKFESFITDHICEFCDKVFEDNIILKKHIQRRHTEPNHSSNEIASLKSFEETKLEALTLMKNFKTKNDAMKFFNWIRYDALGEMKNQCAKLHSPDLEDVELGLDQTQQKQPLNPLKLNSLKFKLPQSPKIQQKGNFNPLNPY